MKDQVLLLCNQAKQAKKSIAHLTTYNKNQLLDLVANNILTASKQILQANQLDLTNPELKSATPALIDRLTLNQQRIDSIVKSILDIIKLPDPINSITYDVNRENGLNIKRITVPLGVLLTIYEARPNVTSDVAALAIKSGNVAILRCGSDSYNTSLAIAKIYQQALLSLNLDPHIVSFCHNKDRNFVQELLQMSDHIDVVIPRGGKSLITAISNNSKIPLFKHLDGNCHIYVHSDADFVKATKIIINAKLRRTGICGAAESLLIDAKIADSFLPIICKDLQNQNCEIRGDEICQQIYSPIKPACEQDYYQEYLDKIISIKVVENIDRAIEWIGKYGSAHTDSIITENQLAAQQFLQQVDSAIVMHNASTQFADGGEFGLGAEVGISTGRMHARGPVGLEQLTTYKYIVSAECGLR